MRTTNLLAMGALMCFGGAAAALAETDGPTITADGFTHHFIANEPPGDRHHGYGVSVLADLNNNGRLDFATAVRNDRLYWFENPGHTDGPWPAHLVGEMVVPSRP